MVRQSTRVHIVAALLFLVMLAGCLGGEGPPEPADAEESEETTPDRATLKGAVITESIELVADALIVLLGAGTTEALQATTGPDGRYELRDLEPGRYRVLVSALCCHQDAAEVNLVAGEERIHNVQLAYIVVEEPYEEEFHWNGFVACMVSVANSAPSCGAGDQNDDRRHDFYIDPGLRTMVVAMDWTPQPDNLQDDLRLRVSYTDCNSQCTYVQVRGPPPLEADVDDQTGGRDEHHFENIEEKVEVTVRVWGDGTPNFVYQQPFTVYFRLFYVEPAPEGFSVLPS